MNQSPPALSEYLSDPPVYAPNGGTFHNGLIYWAASGGNDSIGGMEQRSGIRTVDPLTNQSTTLLNNYFGYYFNTADDLFVHPETGDVWFTDPQYSWFNELTDTPPQLQSGVYRFSPATGAVNIVEANLGQPNGIALAPSLRTVYISDTAATSGVISPFLPSLGAAFNATGTRIVYAYDLDPTGRWIGNKRPVYLALDLVPDGLKVARNGYIVTATGKGVDVLDEVGTLLVRVRISPSPSTLPVSSRPRGEFWRTNLPRPVMYPARGVQGADGLVHRFKRTM